MASSDENKGKKTSGGVRAFFRNLVGLPPAQSDLDNTPQQAAEANISAFTVQSNEGLRYVADGSTLRSSAALEQAKVEKAVSIANILLGGAPVKFQSEYEKSLVVNLLQENQILFKETNGVIVVEKQNNKLPTQFDFGEALKGIFSKPENPADKPPVSNVAVPVEPQPVQQVAPKTSSAASGVTINPIPTRAIPALNSNASEVEKQAYADNIVSILVRKTPNERLEFDNPITRNAVDKACDAVGLNVVRTSKEPSTYILTRVSMNKQGKEIEYLSDQEIASLKDSLSEKIRQNLNIPVAPTLTQDVASAQPNSSPVVRGKMPDQLRERWDQKKSEAIAKAANREDKKSFGNIDELERDLDSQMKSASRTSKNEEQKQSPENLFDDSSLQAPTGASVTEADLDKELAGLKSAAKAVQKPAEARGPFTPVMPNKEGNSATKSGLGSRQKQQEQELKKLKESGSTNISVQKVVALSGSEKRNEIAPLLNNSADIQVKCPPRILKEFQKLVEGAPKLLGAHFENPYTGKIEILPAKSEDFTARHLQLLARNESVNVDGIMKKGLYGDALTQDQVARLRCLVKATTVSGLVNVGLEGGFPKGEPSRKSTPEKMVLIDQSGLQWQGDLRNTGGMFFYPNDMANVKVDNYAAWQTDMYKAMYGGERPKEPSANSVEVKWSSIEGKLDLNQVALGIQVEFLQALEAAGSIKDNDAPDKKVNLRYLKAGMGFFASGITVEGKNGKDHPKLLGARLDGIKGALEYLQKLPEAERKQIIGNMGRLELPFSEGEQYKGTLQEIEKLAKAIGLEWGGAGAKDALASAPDKYINASTTGADPHAMPGNEGGYRSVDAMMSMNARIEHLNAAANNAMKLAPSVDFGQAVTDKINYGLTQLRDSGTTPEEKATAQEKAASMKGLVQVLLETGIPLDSKASNYQAENKQAVALSQLLLSDRKTTVSDILKEIKTQLEKNQGSPQEQEAVIMRSMIMLKTLVDLPLSEEFKKKTGLSDLAQVTSNLSKLDSVDNPVKKTLDEINALLPSHLKDKKMLENFVKPATKFEIEKNEMAPKEGDNPLVSVNKLMSNVGKGKLKNYNKKVDKMADDLMRVSASAYAKFSTNEYYDQAWARKNANELAPNLSAAASTNNVIVANLVVKSIISEEAKNPDEMLKRAIFWAKVLNKSIEKGDYATAMCINTALDNSIIPLEIRKNEELTKISEKSVKILDPGSNFKALRAEYEQKNKETSGFIPYYTGTQGELTMVDEKNTEVRNGILNIDRLGYLGNSLRFLESQSPYAQELSSRNSAPTFNLNGILKENVLNDAQLKSIRTLTIEIFDKGSITAQQKNESTLTDIYQQLLKVGNKKLEVLNYQPMDNRPDYLNISKKEKSYSVLLSEIQNRLTGASAEDKKIAGEMIALIQAHAKREKVPLNEEAIKLIEEIKSNHDVKIPRKPDLKAVINQPENLQVEASVLPQPVQATVTPIPTVAAVIPPVQQPQPATGFKRAEPKTTEQRSQPITMGSAADAAIRQDAKKAEKYTQAELDAAFDGLDDLVGKPADEKKKGKKAKKSRDQVASLGFSAEDLKLAEKALKELEPKKNKEAKEELPAESAVINTPLDEIKDAIKPNAENKVNLSTFDRVIHESLNTEKDYQNDLKTIIVKWEGFTKFVKEGATDKSGKPREVTLQEKREWIVNNLHDSTSFPDIAKSILTGLTELELKGMDAFVDNAKLILATSINVEEIKKEIYLENTEKVDLNKVGTLGPKIQKMLDLQKSNYEKIVVLQEELSKNNLLKSVSFVEQGKNNNTSFGNFFVKPMQRAGKWPLLAREMEKNMPEGLINAGLTEFGLSTAAYMTALNEKKREEDEKSQIREWVKNPKNVTPLNAKEVMNLLVKQILLNESPEFAQSLNNKKLLKVFSNATNALEKNQKENAKILLQKNSVEKGISNEIVANEKIIINVEKLGNVPEIQKAKLETLVGNVLLYGIKPDNIELVQGKPNVSADLKQEMYSKVDASVWEQIDHVIITDESIKGLHLGRKEVVLLGRNLQMFKEKGATNLTLELPENLQKLTERSNKRQAGSFEAQDESKAGADIEAGVEANERKRGRVAQARKMLSGLPKRDHASEKIGSSAVNRTTAADISTPANVKIVESGSVLAAAVPIKPTDESNNEKMLEWASKVANHYFKAGTPLPQVIEIKGSVNTETEQLKSLVKAMVVLKANGTQFNMPEGSEFIKQLQDLGMEYAKDVRVMGNLQILLNPTAPSATVTNSQSAVVTTPTRPASVVAPPSVIIPGNRPLAGFPLLLKNAQNAYDEYIRNNPGKENDAAVMRLSAEIGAIQLKNPLTVSAEQKRQALDQLLTNPTPGAEGLAAFMVEKLGNDLKVLPQQPNRRAIDPLAQKVQPPVPVTPSPTAAAVSLARSNLQRPGPQLGGGARAIDEAIVKVYDTYFEKNLNRTEKDTARQIIAELQNIKNNPDLKMASQKTAAFKQYLETAQSKPDIGLIARELLKDLNAKLEQQRPFPPKPVVAQSSVANPQPPKVSPVLPSRTPSWMSNKTNADVDIVPKVASSTVQPAQTEPRTQQPPRAPVRLVSDSVANVTPPVIPSQQIPLWSVGQKINTQPAISQAFRIEGAHIDAFQSQAMQKDTFLLRAASSDKDASKNQVEFKPRDVLEMKIARGNNIPSCVATFKPGDGDNPGFTTYGMKPGKPAFDSPDRGQILAFMVKKAFDAHLENPATKDKVLAITVLQDMGTTEQSKFVELIKQEAQKRVNDGTLNKDNIVVNKAGDPEPIPLKLTHGSVARK